MAQGRTITHPDSHTLAAYGALAAALLAGFMGGVAATMQVADMQRPAIARLCEFDAPAAPALPLDTAERGDA